MPFEPRTTPFRPGETITPDRMNSMRAENAQLARYFAENFRFPTNPREGLPAFVRHFIGITQAGPDGGGSDYTDSRYYVKIASPKTSLAIGDLFAAAAEKTPNFSAAVTATNLAELPVSTSTAGGTHTVAASTYVHVFGIRTRDQASTPGIWQYVFFHAATPPAVIFAVSVVQNGGANGAATPTNATWTYDVYRYGHSGDATKKLATAATVVMPRPEPGPRTAATFGQGFFDDSGSFVLYDVREPMGAAGCPTGGG